MKEFSESQTASARANQLQTNLRAIQSVLKTTDTRVGPGNPTMKSKIAHKKPPQEAGPVCVGCGTQIDEEVNAEEQTNKTGRIETSAMAG